MVSWFSSIIGNQFWRLLVQVLERVRRVLCLHHRVLVLPQHAGKGTQLSLVTAPAVAVASATGAHTVRAVRALGRANAGAAQLLYRGATIFSLAEGVLCVRATASASS